MADKQFKYVEFVTEIMIASNHVHLSKPDTEGEYADGKYKTYATADESFTEKFQELTQKVANDTFPGKQGVHMPWTDTNEGGTAFIFKSPKNPPRLTDAKGNPLTPDIVIRKGSCNHANATGLQLISPRISVLAARSTLHRAIKPVGSGSWKRDCVSMLHKKAMA